MIKYGNKLIAKAGYYLSSQDGRVGFSLPFSEDLEEKELVGDMEKVCPGEFIKGPFWFVKKDNMKKYLVNTLFSNDDQIAIMLNKDNSDDDMKIYNLMQDWREYFSKLIKEMEEL